MRNLYDVQRSLLAHFLAEWEDRTVIEYPGIEFNPDAVDEWVQVIFAAQKPRPQRRGGHIARLRILAHIYHKFGINTHRIAELGSKVMEIFHQRDITLVGVGVVVRCSESEYMYHGQANFRKKEFEGFETASVVTEAQVE